MSLPFDCISDFMFFETTISHADVILIPGAAQPKLIEKAAELYLSGYAPFILPSGGATPKVETTEWDFLQRIALQLGVPEQAILKEDQAKDTFQNAYFSLDVLQQNHIPFRNVILVCKNYHARRALLTYQFIFPKDTQFIVCPVVDNREVTKDNWYKDEMKITYVMNELEKVGRYFRKAILEAGQAD